MSEIPPPMTLGQILDRTCCLMRAYWRPFLGVAVVPAAAIGAVTIGAMAWWIMIIWPQIFKQPGLPPHLPILPAVLIGASGLLTIPVYALYMPAATYVATQANLGVQVSFRDAYSLAWRRYGRYLWLMVLVILVVAGPFFLAAALIGGGAWLMILGAQPGAMPVGVFMLIPVAILSYLGFVVYSVLMLLRFAVAYPACVAEDLSARASMRRSTCLTCGGRGRIFLVLLVVYAATYLANMVVMTAAGFVVSLGAFAALTAHVTPGSAAFYVLIVLGALVYLAAMVLYAAFMYAVMNTALAVIYHDQRWRKDGIFPSALPA